jgi:hypothetical protein
MEITVILPPDFIGAAEVVFAVQLEETSLFDALAQVRSQCERRLPQSAGAHAADRTLSIGDVLCAEQQYFIVERHGFRPVSAAYLENWRRRSLVERLIGSGEYERVRAKTSGLNLAVAF